MGTKIWERYFLKETLKTFLLFILCFYGLFVLIDYATHAASFHRTGLALHWQDIAFYYLLEFIKRMDVLIPFALLLSTIRTLTNLNVHNELVALMASGVKLKTLLRPFIYLALLFTMLLYLNTELFIPKALKEMKHMDNLRSIAKHKDRHNKTIHNLTLEDGSTLLFQNYDSIEEHFFDAYWIQSADEIYRIKFLYPYKEVAEGHFVDHLERSPAGAMSAKGSYEKTTFPKMKFNNATLFETLTTPDEQSYSELWPKIASLVESESEKQAQLVATFYFKLVMPWICLLAVIAPAPFCINFSRNQSFFFLYACSIFGLVAMYIIMDSALVLAERQVMLPAAAILVPFMGLMAFFGYRYIKK